MSAFLTVENAEFEYEISRSKFIAFCRRVRSDEEATNAIAEIRKKYRDATHVCHAYIAHECARSSDDGEPSGTAGMPIMDALRGAGVNEALVAVVRYFGGIKLGTGGLVRAYSYAANGALLSAGRLEAADCKIYKVSYDYNVYKKIEKRELQSLYKIVKQEYNRAVDLTYAVLNGDEFLKEITSLTQGKFVAEELGERRVERKIAT